MATTPPENRMKATLRTRLVMRAFAFLCIVQIAGILRALCIIESVLYNSFITCSINFRRTFNCDLDSCRRSLIRPLAIRSQLSLWLLCVCRKGDDKRARRLPRLWHARLPPRGAQDTVHPHSWAFARRSIQNNGTLLPVFSFIV